ncbi:MAG: histidine triad nucleotide-binding protein [Atopobiaceae bacterium]|jgi:histidine triad (HIT) family protein
MSDCIFCKIANHEIESDYVYEDDLVCAFKDVNPEAPVHVLVVPKGHYVNLSDDLPADVEAALLHAVREVARITGIDKTGYRVISNAGSDANQVVQHLHLHVLGGEFLGEGLLPPREK